MTRGHTSVSIQAGQEEEISLTDQTHLQIELVSHSGSNWGGYPNFFSSQYLFLLIDFIDTSRISLSVALLRFRFPNSLYRQEGWKMWLNKWYPTEHILINISLKAPYPSILINISPSMIIDQSIQGHLIICSEISQKEKTCWHCFKTSSKIFFSQSRTIRLDSDMKISLSTSLYPFSLCASCFTTILKFWGECTKSKVFKFCGLSFAQLIQTSVIILLLVQFTSIGPMVDVFPKISFKVIIESLSYIRTFVSRYTIFTSHNFL